MPARQKVQAIRGGRDLLTNYAESFSAAIRQSRSLIALRAAKVDAEVAYKARGAFLASMNHELRTPLNAITGFAGLLKSMEVDTEEGRKRTEYLEYIIESADLLLSHINTILEVADAESGGTKLSRRAFDLLDVIIQAKETLEAGDAIKTSIVVDSVGDLPLVDADPDRVGTAIDHIVQYFDSLVGADEAPMALTVSLRAGATAFSTSHVYAAFQCASVYRTPAQIQEDLTAYERAGGGLNRRLQRESLSLPVAKSFIELNGGRFNIKSDRRGGTFVRFALPVAQEVTDQLKPRIAS